VTAKPEDVNKVPLGLKEGQDRVDPLDERFWVRKPLQASLLKNAQLTPYLLLGDLDPNYYINFGLMCLLKCLHFY